MKYSVLALIEQMMGSIFAVAIEAPSCMAAKIAMSSLRAWNLFGFRVVGTYLSHPHENRKQRLADINFKNLKIDVVEKWMGRAIYM